MPPSRRSSVLLVATVLQAASICHGRPAISLSYGWDDYLVQVAQHAPVVSHSDGTVAPATNLQVHPEYQNAWDIAVANAPGGAVGPTPPGSSVPDNGGGSFYPGGDSGGSSFNPGQDQTFPDYGSGGGDQNPGDGSSSNPGGDSPWWDFDNDPGSSSPDNDGGSYPGDDSGSYPGGDTGSSSGSGTAPNPGGGSSSNPGAGSGSDSGSGGAPDWWDPAIGGEWDPSYEDLFAGPF